MTLVRCKESAGNLSCSHEMRLRRGWRGRNTKHGGAGLSAHRPPPLEKTACVHRLRCLLFPDIFPKPAVLQFDHRQGSSDGGALLLKAADRRYGLIACMAD